MSLFLQVDCVFIFARTVARYYLSVQWQKIGYPNIIRFQIDLVIAMGLPSHKIDEFFQFCNRVIKIPTQYPNKSKTYITSRSTKKSILF